MMTGHHFRMMLRALLSNRLRTFLSLLSTAIAIASLTLMLALNRGAELELRAASSKAGDNVITVKAGLIAARAGREPSGGWFPSTRLRAADIVALRERVGEAATIVPVAESTLRVRWNGRAVSTAIRGVGTQYLEARHFEIARGRWLTVEDEREQRRVAVIGRSTAKRLAGAADMVGATVLIGNVPFEVVGELDEKGLSGEGANEDEQILVPLSTAMKRLERRDYFTSLLIVPAENRAWTLSSQELRDLLRSQHRLPAGVRDDFDVFYPVREEGARRVHREFLQALSKTFALITIVISGCGIFAVMYLATNERVPEIGLRIAVGAIRRDIAVLFLMEACLLAGAGGLLGVALGAAAIFILQRITDWTMSYSTAGLALPLAASVVLGLGCGLTPAIRASRLNPVQALNSDG